MIYDVQKIREILPHRYPLLLVDRIVSIMPNEKIEAYKNITINEKIFNGHFPTQPIYPGLAIPKFHLYASKPPIYKLIYRPELRDF